jgi:1-acyl-sn-glycerol-3-phosphate acyltransferase
VSTFALESAIRWLRRWSFADVHIAGIPSELPANEPILLVANHVSWWDGFLLRDVGRFLRCDPIHISVMSAAALTARPYLRNVGAIGVDESITGIRSMERELRRWRARAPERLIVSYFPQGRIWPSTRRPLGFRGGVALVARALAPVTLLPVAMHIEPLASFRPHAFILVGEPWRIVDRAPDIAEVEGRFQRTLDALHRHLNDLGEDASTCARFVSSR